MKKIILLLLLLTFFSSAQEIGAKYLVVTHDNFYDAIQPLVQWKHKKGMRTKVVKLSEIGSTANQIRNYVVAAYNSWQIRPEYLLLVGAPNYLPFPMTGGTTSDNYYTDIDGDIINDILSGRLTVHSSTEADNVVNKILAYERTPNFADSIWFINACLIVREDFDTQDDSIYWNDINHATQLMQAHNYRIIDQFSRAQGHNANDVIQSVNDGRAFVLYRGQGVNNWWAPFDVNPDMTNNGLMLPIVLSITCTTIGTGSTPATAERWLLTGSTASPRGGSGYFATTTIVYNQAYLRSAVCKGFFNAIFSDHKETFGEACEGGRLNVYNQYASVSEYRGFTTIGDPEMHLWTDVPQHPTVTHDTLLYVSAESLIINIAVTGQPADSAIVCVVLDTVVYQDKYTENGSVTFYFNDLVPGIMDVTVTGRNIIPYEGCIIIQDTSAYLLVENHAVNDSLANDNGIPENGETILLDINVRNIGIVTAQDVFAVISSSDTLVSLVDTIAYFGNILPTDSAYGWSPFVISISPFCPSGYSLSFDIFMIDTYGTIWTDTIDLLVSNHGGASGPDEYGYYIYDNTDTLSGHAPVFNWLEIAPPGPGQLVTEITDDDADTVTYALPFTFTYYENDYSTVGMCSNGFIELGNATYRFGDNTAIPATGGPRTMVAGFWDDLDPSQQGDIYCHFDTLNHLWILEFHNCGHYGNPGVEETFQIILRDPQFHPTPTGDGEIVLLYDSVADASQNTVGIEDESEQRGLQYVFDDVYEINGAPIESGRALLVTTKTPTGSSQIPWLYITSYSINDSTSGNGNGIIEPLETLYVDVTVSNNGDTTAYNVQGIIMSTDSDAIILDSTAQFGTLAPGESNPGNVPYRFSVVPAPTDSILGMKLFLTCNDGTYLKNDYFTLYIYGNPNVDEQVRNARVPQLALMTTPNPFRDKVIIQFAVSNTQYDLIGHELKTLNIYDVTGRLVKSYTLAAQYSPLPAVIVWDGRDQNDREVGAGVYFLKIEAEAIRTVKKVVLVK